MLDVASVISNLSQQDLDNSLTQLAAHINAATCRFLVLIAEFDRCRACSEHASFEYLSAL